MARELGKRRTIPSLHQSRAVAACESATANSESRDMALLPLVSFFLCCASLATLAQSAFATEFLVGTYTKPGGSHGIYHFHLDAESGKVTGGELVGEASNPSFITFRAGEKFLYSVNENDKGSVSAFSVGSDWHLTAINKQPSKGAYPCHILVDNTGKTAFASNYGTGNVVVLPIHEDGSLGEISQNEQFKGSGAVKDRQSEPHAHSVYLDATQTYAYACDLGTDWIHGYRFDAAKGTITADEKASFRVPAGSGPRHLAFHPQKDFVYCINEINNTVSGLKRNPADGSLSLLQTISTLPADFKGFDTTAEIAVHPNGKFLYSSNRGHDSIAVMAIADDGQLSLVEIVSTGGKAPRNFAIDPSGKWFLAANMDSNDFFVFKLDERSGKITPTGQRIELPSPVCVLFSTK